MRRHSRRSLRRPRPAASRSPPAYAAPPIEDRRPSARLRGACVAHRRIGVAARRTVVLLLLFASLLPGYCTSTALDVALVLPSALLAVTLQVAVLPMSLGAVV